MIQWSYQMLRHFYIYIYKKKKPRSIDVSRLVLRFKFVHLVTQQVNLI
jgi:hypothetical protein